MKKMDDLRNIFSRIIENPLAITDFQEDLSDISSTYPWFVIPQIIRISLSNNLARKSEIIKSIELNYYANNYYHLQSLSTSSEYAKKYIYRERARTINYIPNICDIKSNNTSKFCNDDTKDNIDISRSKVHESELYPNGRIVITPSGLFYSEETEGSRIIREVIAVNQNLETDTRTYSNDLTAEIIALFLDKKIERIIPKQSDITKEVVNLSINNIEEIITESMAKVYHIQGLNNEAISIYNKLSLKYPEKIRYFADIISSIKLEGDNLNK